MRGALSMALLAACTATGAGLIRSEAVGLRFSVPSAWTRVPAPSDMRAAQFRLPRAEGDADDGELVLFFFGPGKGGGVQDNLERWYRQLDQPGGGSTRDAAMVTTRTVNGLRVTSVDVSGTYTARMGPTHPGPSKPHWRLLAAVVEGPGGPWFWKAVGPAATIAAAEPGFDALLVSLEAHQ